MHKSLKKARRLKGQLGTLIEGGEFPGGDTIANAQPPRS